MHHGKGITTFCCDFKDKTGFTAGEDYELVSVDLEDRFLEHRYGKVGSKWITSLDVSKCGRYVYTVDMDGHLMEFDTSRRERGKDYGKIGVTLWRVRLSTDGKYLFTGQYSGKITQWEISDC
jgi:WD40 repeat protein